MALLTSAAAGLSGINVHAETITDNFQFGVRHHRYDEEPLKEVLFGSVDRYEITANQFSLLAPLTEQIELAVSYQHEKMSGASPWYTLKFDEGKALQVMSGASIEDERTDMSAKLRWADGNKSVAVIAAKSTEDDYDSTSFGIEHAFDTNDKLATWSFSADFSNDKINPVDADIFLTRPNTEQSKHSSSALIGFSRVLNKNTLFQISAGVSKKSGYLSDPYKMVFVDFELVGENRPTSRRAKTLSLRTRYFVDATDSALHLDYRYYDDDWKIKSHTLDIAWYQNLPFDILLVPALRFYSQSQSYFYQVFYTESQVDNYYSNDYRLSEYGANTASLKMIKKFDVVSLVLSADRYISGGKIGLANSKQDNPALLDFTLVSVGFDLQF